MAWLDKAKGLIFEDSKASAPAPEPVKSAATPLGQPHMVSAVNDEYVQALRTALKARSSAFTALLSAADKLTSIIPDANTRLKAAYATVQGEGRGVKEILGAIEVHATDLEGQRMHFNEAADREKANALSRSQTELDTLSSSNAAAQAQIASIGQQIVQLQQQAAQLQDLINKNGARSVELQGAIAAENARFALSRQQFDTAMTVVKSELDGQKQVILSALS